MVKIAKIRYTCWKWWYSPASHGKGIGTATLHELYMDCVLGKVVLAWEMDDPTTYNDFCVCLGEQMMTYDSTN
eukprot:3303148-Ditylum_brightwellii.AAC.1